MRLFQASSSFALLACSMEAADPAGAAAEPPLLFTAFVVKGIWWCLLLLDGFVAAADEIVVDFVMG